MTDQELLALAARAHGNIHALDGCGTLMDDDTGRFWTPLTDDGDALRLAVKLELDIMFFNGDTIVLNVSNGGGEPNERTRRAIVRAVAEIGEDMTE